MALQQLLLLKSYVIVGWLLLLFVAERSFSKTRATYWPASVSAWQRLLRNIGLWLVNTALSPLLIVPLSFWAASNPLWSRPDWWQGGLGLVLDLLLLDCWIYWWHRANHEISLLWRFHRVHHLDEHLDTSSALRFHFGEVVLSALVRVVVIVALGIPIVSVIVFEVLVMLCAIFHHSDIRLPERVENQLSKWVITPSIHWVHHHAVRSDTDSNYGTILSVWDKLFATRSSTVRVPEMQLGVERESELNFWHLLIAPFITGQNRRVRRG